MTELLPLLLIVGVFLFVTNRQQQKQAQKVQALLDSLHVGADVITIGGLHGSIVDMDDTSVDLRVSANGIVLRFQKGSIAQVVTEDLDSEDSDDGFGAVEDVVTGTDVSEDQIS